MSNSQYKTSKQPDRKKPQPKNLGPRLRKKFDIKYKSFEEPSSIKTNFHNAKKVEENNKNHLSCQETKFRQGSSPKASTQSEIC